MITLRRMEERWSRESQRNVMLPGLGATTCGEAADAMSRFREKVRHARSQLLVEYADGRILSVGHDSLALRKVVGLLDEAIREQP